MKYLSETEILDWKSIADHCDEIEGLSENDKRRAKQAFLFLRDEFGENFLKDNLENRHPLFGQIINHVAHTRIWFADFAESIQEVKNCQNYGSLLKRLKGSLTFTEGESVLEVACKFSRAGLQIEFDPRIQVHGNPKMPDLKLINKDSNESHYCEVSISKMADEQVEAQQTEFDLFASIRASVPLRYAGRVHKLLSENRKREILSQVSQLSKIVAEETGFGELVLDGTLTLAICTPEHENRLTDWADKHGYDPKTLSGPPVDVDEFRRMRIKIAAKHEQLPRDTANLIVIRDSDFFYPVRDIGIAMNILEESIFDFDNLFAVVIMGGYWGDIKQLEVRRGFHLYLQKQRNLIDADQYLILWNRFCTRPVSPATISKVYSGMTMY